MSTATILFDLDGTLIDTAPDMVAALNVLLADNDRETIDYALARSHVSKGALGLVDVAFGEIDEAHRMSLRDRYLEVYEAALAVESALFPGMDLVLETIEQAGKPWGIVTNKPAYLTEPLLKSLGLTSRSSVTVCGDTLAKRKPHPLPLLHAAEQLGIDPRHAIYVGDDARDIVAGNAAGMTTVAALYGFIPPEDNPHDWPANIWISQPQDLLTLLG